MELCDLAPAYVRAIAPYPPGKPIGELAREMGLNPAEIVKLASNENPLGPSPLALEAVQRCLPELARYPDGAGFELKTALAAHHGVTVNQIVLGNGSNDVLEFAARAFLGPGTSAVFSQHAFAVYPLAAQAVGARAIEVPARDFGNDPVALLEAIEDDTRVVFLANPNNPTGTLLAPQALLHFIEQVPREVLVVLDEAYYEYLPAEVAPPSTTWLARFPNLMLTRTFSKAYGLAGLRVGYALCHPDVADMLNRVRQPFNVSTVAQAAAQAALGDSEHLTRSITINRVGMAQITTGLTRLGLAWIPSYGNFLSFCIGNATAMYQRLLRRGVIVRPIANYGLPEYLRVSIGLERENERFLTALASALEEQRKETA
ncbi:histidinol-phosphate transaminase [Thiobacter aerophilum]|uniref:Histidinol-phosphate aminotransferase n=1 Tax=Thiobacter aerophilum TaxID=3121275 RepID=A0ABV0EFH1_9BURK